MLAKKNRFHGHKSLNYVYNRGVTVRSPFCSMKAVRGRRETYRVAVVVSKKVAKSAPVRNRLRRRVYEAIRLLAPQLLTNQDIVVTIFDEKFINIDNKDLVNSIRRQLQEITDKT